MEKKVEISILCQIYGKLLTEKQYEEMKFLVGKPSVKEKRVNYCLIAICALCLCLWGGIYDFTIAIYGCIFCIGIITVVRKKDRLSIPVSYTHLTLPTTSRV